MQNKVFMYCRKSSESEDRQILSIDSQIKELEIVAKRLNLKIVKVFTESKSAKAPGRLIFSEMLERIYKGEADGVLCWKLDRLARNPIDGGLIIWAIKKNGMNIYTPSQQYSQEQENQLLMYVEFGMAQKFIDDLSKNVKRGMNAKAEMGWWPQNAPLGYINTPSKKKGLRTIEKDPERFDIVKKCFKEVANGRNAMSVYKEAIEDWHLTGPRSGKPIAQSTFYKVLNSPFYFGDFYWNEKWFTGKHEAMINKDEFEVVQRMLGKKGKPIQRKQTFDLTGLFRCEQCGCALTATKKTKFYKRTKHLAEYTYYHCTKKRKDIICTQKPIKENDMIEKVAKRLNEVQPSIGFIKWAKKWIDFLHQNESQFQNNIADNGKRKVTQIDNRLSKLLDLYIDGDLEKNSYDLKKKELEKEKHDLERKIKDSNENSENWKNKIEDVLDFTKAVVDKFKSGSKEEKHQILIKLSSDLFYKSKEPMIYLKEEYKPVEKLNKGEYNTVSSARTSKYADIFVERPDLAPANSTWLRAIDAIRTCVMQKDARFYCLLDAPLA